MYTLAKIQEEMRRTLHKDRARPQMHASGSTIDEALEVASVGLSLPKNKIQYEILARSSAGLLGLGKRSVVIIASPIEDAMQLQPDLKEITELAVKKKSPKNGEAFVRLTPNGIMLKVTSPDKGMRSATVDEAISKIRSRTSAEINRLIVEHVVRIKDGSYVKIGEYNHNISADPVISVSIQDSEMKAYISVAPQNEGGADISADDIVAHLAEHEITTGIKHDVLRRFEDDPQFNESILVAEGTKADKGKDAKIIFNFENQPNYAPTITTGDRVDFKNINLIRNVIEGQILARKSPPENGKNGITVTGKEIQTTNGKDIPILIGEHVRLSEDGLTAYASINGHVTTHQGKISVHPLYIVSGDVNLKTGNVTFLGTVIVKGNIDDGFSVEATKMIEVYGFVGKARLHSDGNIVVHRGIAGKGEATIECGGNLWSKFIENTTVDAQGLVVVSDGIINSLISTRKKVICRGKRANIVGGVTRAIQGVDANSIGSIASSETIIEVGFDPRLRESIIAMNNESKKAQLELETIRKNVEIYQNLQKAKKRIPPNRLEFFTNQIQKQDELNTIIATNAEKLEKTQELLNHSSHNAMVSASQKVYPGVRITIKHAILETRNEFKASTFVLENNTIKVTAYEQSKDNIDINTS